LKETLKLKVHARTNLFSGVRFFILSGQLMCKTNHNFEKVRCVRNIEIAKNTFGNPEKKSDGLETNLFAAACALWSNYGLFVGALVGVFSWTTSKSLARRPHSQPVRFAPGLDCGGSSRCANPCVALLDFKAHNCCFVISGAGLLAFKAHSFFGP
jgi:hypothetical protein